MGTLLLGSGLNRCMVGYPSWDGLLSDISNEFFCNVGIEDDPLLMYDMMLCQAESEHGSAGVNSKLEELLGGLKAEDMSSADLDFLSSVQSCGLKTILTTNFDYNLEQALEGSDQSLYRGYERKLKYSNENRKSNIRRNEIGDLAIHHIHGELDFPRSICLGMTRYIENLSRIRELLSCRKEDEDGTLYRLPIDEEIFTNPKRTRKTWAELFFNDNVYIVGLGLTSSELDIWWLLIRRAQLIAQGSEETRPRNHIVYFPVTPADSDPFNPASYGALQVKTKPLQVRDDDWRPAYKKIWGQIRELESKFESATKSNF